jgi:hypothetical protein
MGFHAPQEAARVLGEAADYARQGQIAALKWRSGGNRAPADGVTRGSRNTSPTFPADPSGLDDLVRDPDATSR